MKHTTIAKVQYSQVKVYDSPSRQPTRSGDRNDEIWTWGDLGRWGTINYGGGISNPRRNHDDI